MIIDNDLDADPGWGNRGTCTIMDRRSLRWPYVLKVNTDQEMTLRSMDKYSLDILLVATFVELSVFEWSINSANSSSMRKPPRFGFRLDKREVRWRPRLNPNLENIVRHKMKSVLLFTNSFCLNFGTCARFQICLLLFFQQPKSKVWKRSSNRHLVLI